MITACWDDSNFSWNFLPDTLLDPKLRPKFSDILIALQKMSIPDDWKKLFMDSGMSAEEVIFAHFLCLLVGFFA
jgi:ABC-type nitrate/sulfonate/bicarbonate transport system permease component